MVITPEELKARQSVIGASDAGIILGLNPWKTRVDLWHDKVYGCSFKGNAATRRGNKFEPMVISFAEEHHGITIVPDVRFERSVQHKGHKVTFRANCDGVVVEPGEKVTQYDRFMFGDWVPEKVVEAKTASPRAFESWGMPNTDEIPDTYLVQTIIQMWCSGATHCHVPVMCGFDEYMFEVKRPDDLTVNEVVRKCADFWVDHVVPKVRPEGPPPPVKLMSTIERAEDSVISIDNGIAKIADKWVSVSEARRELAKEEDALKRALIESLGNSEVGVCDAGCLTYLANTRGARTLKWKPDQWMEVPEKS